MKVWQIATGEPGRDYRELFFDHDMMIMGPSHLGDASSNRYASGSANSPNRQVHNFTYGPKQGDRVLMRFAHDVIGVGQIPEEGEHQYSFSKAFRCVYGWDLCHCRRVTWAENYELGDLALVYKTAKQKPTFTRVHEQHIVKMVQDIKNTYFKRPLKELPNIDSSVYSDEELGIELFRAGISNKNVSDILVALQQAERLLAWYPKSGRSPSENEIVSHLILPLFLGLGWSHQQIAVEWNKVDMVFFKKTPTTKENCVMVLEAKGLGQALSDVLGQPKSYVRSLKLTNVKHILTTDGENLFVYEKSGNDWVPNPSGYFNVRTLQKQYVVPKNTSLVDTLVRLQPSAV
jgi:hypothetical protein